MYKCINVKQDGAESVCSGKPSLDFLINVIKEKHGVKRSKKDST